MSLINTIHKSIIILKLKNHCCNSTSLPFSEYWKTCYLLFSKKSFFNTFLHHSATQGPFLIHTQMNMLMHQNKVCLPSSTSILQVYHRCHHYNEKSKEMVVASPSDVEKTCNWEVDEGGWIALDTRRALMFLYGEMGLYLWF